jgi:NAD(P)-dependent dehydrogenase (short-subunit alcohol dehydrogenase family)
LAGLTKCAALDYARQGIRVNAIAPGPTRSEMFDRWMPTDEARAAMAGRFPMNYIADPDDMARAALFLLSEDARWTTGAILPCEGGMSAD